MSRLDIADLLADAFGPCGALRSDLLEVATAKGAHPRIIDDLRALPDRRYTCMRDLWPWLSEVPVP